MASYIIFLQFYFYVSPHVIHRTNVGPVYKIGKHVHIGEQIFFHQMDMRFKEPRNHRGKSVLPPIGNTLISS